jgi:hypothetical protein
LLAEAILARKADLKLSMLHLSLIPA